MIRALVFVTSGNASIGVCFKENIPAKSNANTANKTKVVFRNEKVTTDCTNFFIYYLFNSSNIIRAFREITFSFGANFSLTNVYSSF